MDKQEDGNSQQLPSKDSQKLLQSEKNGSILPILDYTLIQENDSYEQQSNPFNLDTANNEWDEEIELSISEQALNEMIEEYEKKYHETAKYFNDLIDKHKRSLKMLELETKNVQKKLQIELFTIYESNDLVSNEKELVGELKRLRSLLKIIDEQYMSINEGNKQQIWENFNKLSCDAFSKLNEELKNIRADINERKEKYEVYTEKNDNKLIELPQKERKELEDPNCVTENIASDLRNTTILLDSLTVPDSEENEELSEGQDQISAIVNLKKCSKINESMIQLTGAYRANIENNNFGRRHTNI